MADSIVTPEGATPAQAETNVAQRAAAKGFRLYYCMPLYAAGVQPLWMLHHDASMRFCNSWDALTEAVDALPAYAPLTVEQTEAQARMSAALAELMGE